MLFAASLGLFAASLGGGERKGETGGANRGETGGTKVTRMAAAKSCKRWELGLSPIPWPLKRALHCAS